MTDQKRKKRSLGVTLIEVLIAMVILSIGLYMTYNTFPLGFAASYRSKNKTIATELAQQILERVIKNQQLSSCCKDKNIVGKTYDCRVKPMDTRLPTENYDSGYDCRYYYGGLDADDNVQNGSYCFWHMGTRDVGNWARFSGVDTDDLYNWWYHIDVTPVIDPAQKFRSGGDLCRITVSVRGPIEDLTKWDINSKMGYKPTEVIVSTLKANKFMACTEIDPTGRWGGLKTDGMAVYVENVRNFTVINRDSLTQEEMNDRPKVSIFARNYLDPTTTLDDRYLNMIERDGNFYNLDNCLITRSATYDFFSNTAKSIGPHIPGKEQTIQFQASMTNKIVYIAADTWVNPETTYKIPGELHFLHPLYSEDSDLAATSNLYPADSVNPTLGGPNADYPDPNMQCPSDPASAGNAGFTSRYTRNSTGSVIPAVGDPAFTSFTGPPNEPSADTVIWWRDYYFYNVNTSPQYDSSKAENEYIAEYSWYNTSAREARLGWWQRVDSNSDGSVDFRLFIDKFVHANICYPDTGGSMKLYPSLDDPTEKQTYYIQQLINVRTPAASN